MLSWVDGRKEETNKRQTRQTIVLVFSEGYNYIVYSTFCKYIYRITIIEWRNSIVSLGIRFLILFKIAYFKTFLNLKLIIGLLFKIPKVAAKLNKLIAKIPWKTEKEHILTCTKIEPNPRNSHAITLKLDLSYEDLNAQSPV